MIGPFELTSRTVKQVEAAIETLPERIGKFQIVEAPRTNFPAPPFVATDALEKAQKAEEAEGAKPKLKREATNSVKEP